MANRDSDEEATENITELAHGEYKTYLLMYSIYISIGCIQPAGEKFPS